MQHNSNSLVERGVDPAQLSPYEQGRGASRVSTRPVILFRELCRAVDKSGTWHRPLLDLAVISTPDAQTPTLVGIAACAAFNVSEIEPDLRADRTDDDLGASPLSSPPVGDAGDVFDSTPASWSLQTVARSALRFGTNSGAGEAFLASQFLVVAAPQKALSSHTTVARAQSSEPALQLPATMIRGESSLVYARYVSPLERCPWQAIPATRIPLYVPQVRAIVFSRGVSY